MSYANKVLIGFVIVYFLLAYVVGPHFQFMSGLLSGVFYLFPVWLVTIVYLLICLLSYCLRGGRDETPWYGNKAIIACVLLAFVLAQQTYHLTLNYYGYCAVKNRILTNHDLCQIVVEKLNGSPREFVFLTDGDHLIDDDVVKSNSVVCEVGDKRTFKTKGPEIFHPVLHGPKKQFWGQVAGLTRNVVVVNMDGIENAYMRTNCGIANTHKNVRSFWDLYSLFPYPAY